MRYSELMESIVNAFDKEDMEKYKDRVWELLQIAYKNIGGFQSATDADDLMGGTGLWKMTRRNGVINSVVVYRDIYGRKSIGVGHDGTERGKKDVKAIVGEDISLLRSWAEVSGPSEKLRIRLGARPIPNKYAEALTGEKILSYNDDGYHYTRLIAGKPYEKIIVGNPRDFDFDPDDDVTMVKKD